MSRYSKIITFIWIAIILTDNIFNLYMTISLKAHPLYGLQKLSWAIFMFGRIIAIPMLLIYVYYGVYLMEKRLILKTDNSFEFNCNHLERQILMIQKFKIIINKSLNIFPFLWFCELFIITCFRLQHILLNPDYNINNMYYLHKYHGYYEYLCFIIIDFGFVLAANYFQTHRPTVNELLSSVGKHYPSMTTRELMLKNILIQNLVHNYSQTKYTAFNVFTINIKFLFVFMGSVITFTVILIQLLDK